ncbi:MAG: hypothetical protein H0U44_12850 [Flavisolibacter sp.]|jgi:hypothetical protein|nr:hypothetical protein [Flavisolibacter sp.]
MKKLIIPFIALFVIAISLVSWRSNTAMESADVIKDFTCGITGPDGFQFTDESHSVVTSSGNSILKCHASGVSNSTGKVWKASGFLCSTFLGITDDTHKVVTPSGQATLTCKVH